jgi:hypothetical protein
MANWALIEDNKIKELHDLLPKNWRNISGLRLSLDNLQFLKSLGWYPVVKKHQEYDKNLYNIDGFNHVFLNDCVIETLILVKKTKESRLSNEDFLIMLREERNRRLFLSDWTQLHDVLSIMDDSEKSKWSIYRKLLRDLPEKYKNNEFVDIYGIEWPNFEMIELEHINNEE